MVIARGAKKRTNMKTAIKDLIQPLLVLLSLVGSVIEYLLSKREPLSDKMGDIRDILRAFCEHLLYNDF